MCWLKQKEICRGLGLRSRTLIFSSSCSTFQSIRDILRLISLVIGHLPVTGRAFLPVSCLCLGGGGGGGEIESVVCFVILSYEKEVFPKYFPSNISPYLRRCWHPISEAIIGGPTASALV